MPHSLSPCSLPARKSAFNLQLPMWVGAKAYSMRAPDPRTFYEISGLPLDRCSAEIKQSNNYGTIRKMRGGSLRAGVLSVFPGAWFLQSAI